MAENSTVVVTLKVDDQMSGPIASASNKVDASLKQSKSAFADLGNEIKTNFTSAIKGAVIGYLGFQSIQRVTGFLKDARMEFKESVQMQSQLRTALGYTSQALNEQAAALGRKLIVDNEEITAVQIKLANYVKNEEQIKRLTPAVLDLAAATGMDMASAANMVARGIADDNDELGRFKISVDGARGSAERVDSVIRGINEGMGKQAIAVAESKDWWDRLNISIKQYKENLWENIQGPSKEQLYNEAKKALELGGMTVNTGFASTFVKNNEAITASLKKTVEEYEIAINKAKVINANKTMGPQQETLQQKDERLKKEKEASEERAKIQEEELRRNRVAGEIAYSEWRAQDEADIKASWEKQQLKIEQDKKYADNKLYINTVMQEELNKSSEESFKLWVKQEQQKAEIEKRQKEQSISFALGTMAAIFAGQHKYIAAYKTFAIAQAVMDTYAAANTALKSAPPPFNFISAGVSVAAGLANVAKISSQKFATGTASAGGGMALVGENGPEYVNLPRGAQVYNNTQTRNMTTNAALNVTITDASGNITETVRAQLRSGQADQLVRDIQSRMARMI